MFAQVQLSGLQLQALLLQATQHAVELLLVVQPGDIAVEISFVAVKLAYTQIILAACLRQQLGALPAYAGLLSVAVEQGLLLA